MSQALRTLLSMFRRLRQQVLAPDPPQQRPSPAIQRMQDMAERDHADGTYDPPATPGWRRDAYIEAYQDAAIAWRAW